MDSIRSPIWVGWLVWTPYGPDRESSLLTYLHNDTTGALPLSATGRGLGRAAIGRTEQTARIGADIAVSAPLLLERLLVIVSCDGLYTTQRALVRILSVTCRGSYLSSIGFCR